MFERLNFRKNWAKSIENGMPTNNVNHINNRNHFLRLGVFAFSLVSLVLTTDNTDEHKLKK